MVDTSLRPPESLCESCSMGCGQILYCHDTHLTETCGYDVLRAGPEQRCRLKRDMLSRALSRAVRPLPGGLVYRYLAHVPTIYLPQATMHTRRVEATAVQAYVRASSNQASTGEKIIFI